MALLLNNSNVTHPDVNFSAPPNTAVDLTLHKHSLLSSPYSLNSFQNPVSSAFTPFKIPDLFKLPAPTFIPMVESIYPLLPSVKASHKIYALAARILSTIIVWAKNIPSFATLTLSDRLLLLEESWREIFTVTSAHILQPLDWRIVIDDKNNKIDMNEIAIFEEILDELIKVKPDIAEYGYLSGIALFKTNFGENNVSTSSKSNVVKRLQDVPAVASLQEQSQRVFIDVSNQILLIFFLTYLILK